MVVKKIMFIITFYCIVHVCKTVTSIAGGSLLLRTCKYNIRQAVCPADERLTVTG